MADSEAKEVKDEPQNNSEEQEKDTPQQTEIEAPEEDMDDFDLVGLSPESEKNKTTNPQSEDTEETKANLADELNEAESTQDSDNEETTLNRRRRSADVRLCFIL